MINYFNRFYNRLQKSYNYRTLYKAQNFLYHYKFYHRADVMRSARAERTLGEKAHDGQLVERIIMAYQRSVSTESGQKHTMWERLNGLKEDVHIALIDGNVERVAGILRNPQTSNLFHGFDTLCLGRLSRPELVTNEESALVMDGLIRCAEAFGARRVENPANYRSGVPRPQCVDPDEVLAEIDLKCGTKILFPNPFPGENGVYTSRGIVSYRVPQAIYQAWRLKECTKQVSSPRVMELGAGLGRTAYYAYIMGLTNYSIVDLPLAGVAQAYFLGRVLGPDKITLEGETLQNNTIAITAPQSFFDGDNSYDIVLNSDGLTEMDISVARMYWSEIERRANILLSINHEINEFTVQELIQQYGPYQRASRSPSWLRRGYVENEIEFRAKGQ